MDGAFSPTRHRVMEQGYGERRATAEGGWLDAEVRDSFPASDPLSHWAGPARPISEADRAQHFAGPAATEVPGNR